LSPQTPSCRSCRPAPRTPAFSPPVAWNAQDAVELVVEAGGQAAGTYASYRVNGGPTIVIGTGAALGPMQVTGAIDILCTGTSNQLSAWIQRLSFLAGGVRPSGM
jgi:hypothetical protein